MRPGYAIEWTCIAPMMILVRLTKSGICIGSNDDISEAHQKWSYKDNNLSLCVTTQKLQIMKASTPKFDRRS